MSDTELHHLLNRAIDGVVLHGESDRLRELVRALEERAEQAEAAIERVRDLATRWDNALAPDKRYARAVRDALDQPQQPNGEPIPCRGCQYFTGPGCQCDSEGFDQPQQPTTTA